MTPPPETLRPPRPAAAGFTLMELVVVMGILSGFLVMLVQMVDSGVRLFDEGESGQALADRGEAARTAVAGQLSLLHGPGLEIEPGPPADRMLLQLLPLGLPARSALTDARGPVLRAAVQLEPDQEQELVLSVMSVQAALELGVGDTAAIGKRAAELAASRPLRGRGRVLLLLWPKTGDGALLELRVAQFLPEQRIQLGGPGSEREVDPFAVPVPGTAELPALVVHAATRVLADDLLHFELRCWSQTTAAWDGAGRQGPEMVWDSARAGWLADPALGPVFALDRDGQSLDDPTDDVYPHALLVRLCVAADPARPPEGLLADDLEPDARTLRLLDGERFPGASAGGFVKVEGEWMRYAERQGDELRGLVRGQRSTPARAHQSGAVCRVGRSIEFVVPLAHAKDDWNG